MSSYLIVANTNWVIESRDSMIIPQSWLHAYTTYIGAYSLCSAAWGFQAFERFAMEVRMWGVTKYVRSLLVLHNMTNEFMLVKQLVVHGD
jgi:hypothetical protein